MVFLFHPAGNSFHFLFSSREEVKNVSENCQESDQNLWGTRAGFTDRGAATFFQVKKGGDDLFSAKKKGAPSFYQRKKRGRRVFFSKKGGDEFLSGKKGGEEFF